MLYDAFCVFNEMDTIEIRLNELYDVVDYFIIHESTRTHTGYPKPLYFSDNYHRFAKFGKKIIYRLIQDTPDSFLYLDPSTVDDPYLKIVYNKINNDTFWDKNHLPYSRDAYEKESLIRSMGGVLKENDIVMFSDADEIARASVVSKIKENFDKNSIYHLAQKHFWFYYNVLRDDVWYGNTLLSFENFKKTENSVCRLRKERAGIVYGDAGWHFSFMGGRSGVLQKIEGYGEQSINKPYVTHNVDGFIDHCINNNHDFYMRPVNFKTIPVSIDNHPDYLVRNSGKFSKQLRNT